MAAPNPLKIVNARIDVVRAIARSLDPEALRERLAPLRGLSYRNHPAVLDLTEIDADHLSSVHDTAPWSALRDCFEEIGLKVVALAVPDGFVQSDVLALLLGLAQIEASSMAVRRPSGASAEAAAAAPARPESVVHGETRQGVPVPATDVTGLAKGVQGPAAGVSVVNATQPESPSEASMTEPEWLPPLVIERHVRSGQQIYGRHRDLLILASVSPGAEVIADGNITCLGELRGRAIAGASGKTDARILCLDFRPELVAVAGIYKTFEAGPPAFAPGRTVQVRQDREGDGLSISVI